MLNVTITQIEKNLVASLLRDPSMFANLKQHVPEEMFSMPIYAKSIRGMHLAAENSAAIDAVNVSTLAKFSSKELGELIDLVGDNSAGGYAPELFRQLLNERTKYSVLQGIKRIGKSIIAGEYDALELLGDIKSMHEGLNAEILSHVTETREDKIERYRTWVESGANTAKAIATPFPTLNNMTGRGFRPTDYVLIGGRAGAGKTSFMLAVALAAAKLGKKVAFLSGEMPDTEIYDRLAGIHSGCEIGKLREGFHSDKLSDFYKLMRTIPLEVIECFENSIEELQREVGALLYKKYDMIVIDYLQKFAYSPKARDEFSEIMRVSSYLRNYSLKSNAVFLVASSLNRDEMKQGKKISLNSFYGSSKLGHDGTLGLILDADEDDASEMSTGFRDVTLKVAKNRNGARGEINLSFNLRTQRMSESGFAPAPSVPSYSYPNNNDEEEDAF